MNDRDQYDGSVDREVPGQVHRNYRRDRRKKRWYQRQLPKIPLRQIAAVALALVMVISLVKLVSWTAGVITTWQTNRELQAMRNEAIQAQMSVTQEPLMTPYHQAAVTTPAPAPAAYAGTPQRTPISLVTPTPVPQNKLFYRTAGEMLPDMKALYQKNNDLIGWLNIPGVVDLPVVYRDNSYYLDKDFYKKSSKSGTLFLDVNHPLKDTTQHLVIHGHNMNDGSMFGLLAHYKNKSYIREHGIVTFSTLYEKQNYAVVAVAITSENAGKPGFIPYIGNPVFHSASAFNYYMKKVEAGSLYKMYLDVQPTDALLTLSTCLDDDRLLIVCRRVRDGESLEDVRRVQRYSID